MPEQDGVRPIDRFFRAVNAVGNAIDNAPLLRQYREYRQNRRDRLAEEWNSAPFEDLARDMFRYNLKTGILYIGALDLTALRYPAASVFSETPLVAAAILTVGIGVSVLGGIHGGYMETVEQKDLLDIAKQRGFRIVRGIPFIAKIGNHQSSSQSPSLGSSPV